MIFVMCINETWCLVMRRWVDAHTHRCRDRHTVRLTHTCSLSHTHTRASSHAGNVWEHMRDLPRACVCHSSWTCVTWLHAELSLLWTKDSNKMEWLLPPHKHYMTCITHKTKCKNTHTHILFLALSLSLSHTHMHKHGHFSSYGVATISRLLKIIGLFCKRAL